MTETEAREVGKAQVKQGLGARGGTVCIFLKTQREPFEEFKKEKTYIQFTFLKRFLGLPGGEEPRGRQGWWGSGALQGPGRQRRGRGISRHTSGGRTPETWCRVSCGKVRETKSEKWLSEGSARAGR